MEPQPPKVPSTHKSSAHGASKGGGKKVQTKGHVSKAVRLLPASLKLAREAAASRTADSVLHKAAQVNVRAHSIGK